MGDCKSKCNAEEWYLVEVVETLTRTVKVKAENAKAAYAAVEDAYHDCRIILDAEDIKESCFYPRKADDENLELYESI